MSHRFCLHRVAIVLLAMFSVVIGSRQSIADQRFLLRNGLTLVGSKVEISSLNQNPFAAAGGGEIQVRPIWMIDDGLRRTYVHEKGMIAGKPIDIRDVEKTLFFHQPTPLGGKEVAGIGSILEVTQFNQDGRRIFTVRGPSGGPLRIFQGITELNSRYAKVEGLKATPSYVMDMRVATSSLDSNTLRTIFRNRINQTDIDRRLEVVRFFIETKRYGDAREELKEIIAQFPQEKDLVAQVAAITEFQAIQLLEEAETRAEAGQDQLASQILQNFPTAEVGRQTRLQVQDAIKKLSESRDQAAGLVKQLRGQVGQLAPPQTAALQPIIAEIAAGLSPATLPRLSDYIRLGNAAALPVDNRVALAVAGWLLGSGSGEQNLSVATSLIQVRDLVAEYLVTTDEARRQKILDQLRNMEGAEPEYVNRILPLLLPPLPWPDGSASEKVEGMHAVGLDDADQPVRYLIQLPPQYDPLREYPCIVALHPTRGTLEGQLDWWAGRYSDEMKARMGHATRQGFIVMAPRWTRDRQRAYEYTPLEHQRVLASLRDAMRRASIDADRVFLAGQGEGASAAWDIALSHPDLWAGMISISGEPRKTVAHYAKNSEHVPMYLVMGENDGAPAPLIRNGPTMDDYMTVRHDAMVVMYRGRGREFFYDEIHQLFDWMRLPTHRRKEQPAEIDVATMRTGDQFFWWLELGDLKTDVAINPILWDQAKRLRAGKVEAAIGAGNQIRIGQGPTETFTVWLRPHPSIDMTKRVTVRYRSRRVDLDYDGSLEVMLEDARRRADRKRPYWAKVTIP